MKPLEGLRIIDLTVAVAGPVAAHYLGDLGADVIRVEPPFARPMAHLDVAPPLSGMPDRPYNRGVGYNDLQRSKRGVTLDLGKPPGRDALLRLVRASDAVIENMSPRVMPSLGLSYEDLRAVKPDIVLLSMPAFGRHGPLRDRVSYGPGIDAMCGLAHLNGYAGGAPMNAANYFHDYSTAVLAAFSLLAAIRHRDRTGRGQHAEVAMIDGALQTVAMALIGEQLGQPAQRAANAHPAIAPHGVYPCAGDDEWLAVSCEDDEQWRALCRAIERPDLASNLRFADVASRVRHHRDLDALLSAWTARRYAQECACALQRAGVAAAPVQSVRALFDDPQMRHRGWIQDVVHPEAGSMPLSRAPFTLSCSAHRIERPAPRFGEHNDEVLPDIAGLSEAEMQALRATGALRDEPPAAR